MEENLDGNAGSAAVPSATAVAALQRYTGERQPGSRPERMGSGAGVRFYAGELFFAKRCVDACGDRFKRRVAGRKRFMGEKRKFWQLTVRTQFSAAHALRHYEGRCERLHGHNFGVELTVEGEVLSPDTEILVDFKILKNMLRTVLDALDHQILNEIPPFDQINPSSENLSRYIWRQVEAPLRELGVRPYAVCVSEKDAQSATYREV